MRSVRRHASFLGRLLRGRLLLLAAFFTLTSSFLRRRILVRGPIQQRRPPKRQLLLVKYHYHETEKTEPCEVLNKRLNLHLFIQNTVLKDSASSGVDYLFSVSGELPDVGSFARSLGVSNLHPSQKYSIFPQLANVRVFSFGNPDAPIPDLCFHYSSLTNIGLHLRYDYIFFLNDGARGPFIKQRAKDSTTNLPLWFHPFLEKFAASPKAVLVGTTLSCEISPHIQSWGFALDTSFSQHFFPALERACFPGITKSQAIDVEVSLSSVALSLGFSISGLYPVSPPLSRGDAPVVSRPSSLRSILHNCSNPLMGAVDIDPFETVFVKYGGGAMKSSGFLSEAYHESIRRLTIPMFPSYNSLFPTSDILRACAAGRLRAEFAPKKYADNIAVIYAYAEHGAGLSSPEMQRYNLNFFIRVGIRGNTPGSFDPENRVDFVIVVSGSTCSPCDTTLKMFSRYLNCRTRMTTGCQSCSERMLALISVHMEMA